MRKNAFLTFCCAVIPGAGQMYLGYLRRGLCLMVAFFALIAATSVIYLFGFALPVCWAFSFFDTYRLRNALENGTAEPDAYLFGVPGDDSFSIVQSFFRRRHLLVGWGLVLLGGWLLLDKFVLGPVLEVFYRLNFYFGIRMIRAIPSLIVAVLLIALGFLLIRGRRNAPSIPPEDEDYVEYQGDDTHE